MSSNQIPPWLQEQMLKLQQSQQNLQSIMTQKQQLEMDQAETEKALDELKKADDSDLVYKFVGSVLLRSTKQELTAELEERKDMSKTRSIVLAKQETKVKETLKEQETKINEMMRGKQPSETSTPGDMSADDNPRR